MLLPGEALDDSAEGGEQTRASDQASFSPLLPSLPLVSAIDKHFDQSAGFRQSAWTAHSMKR